jgi:hypothetical protein
VIAAHQLFVFFSENNPIQRIRRGALWGLMLCAIGCNDASTPSSSPLQYGPLSAHGIRYILEWDLADVIRNPDGSWTVENSEGHLISVRDAYLINYSASLVPCEYWDDVDQGVSWLKLLGISTAYAGHSGDTDPSASRFSIVESLGTPTDGLLDEVTVPPQEYCKVHYLTARADSQTQNLPTELNLEGLSLYLEGDWIPVGETQSQVLSIETDLAYGVLEVLSEGGVEPDLSNPKTWQTADGGIEIAIRRKLSTIFDGVDLTDADTRRVGFEIMKRLLSGTTIEVRQ